ncbi:hypothetical protein V1523DRAFT_427681 [Lipomyces doorenjongii]
MVGLAGGSRACTNCQRRKIKCDETFPKCLRCVRSNLNCEGPKGEHLSPSTEERVDNIVTVESPYPASNEPPTALHRPDNDTIQYHVNLFRRLQNIPRDLALFPEHDLYNYFAIPQFVLANAPSSTTFAARSLVIAYYASICHDSDVSLIAANWYVMALRYQKEVVGLMASDSSFFESEPTSMSLDVTRMGPEEVANAAEVSKTRSKASSRDVILEWSASATSSAQKPRRTMRGNIISLEDDSVIAGMLISIYEALNSETEASWIDTLSGSIYLMQVRGPKSYREGFNNTCFLAMRGVTAIQAFVTRRETFLNSHEWKTIPWELSRYRKADLRLPIRSRAGDPFVRASSRATLSFD